jgi:hypothetical protein
VGGFLVYLALAVLAIPTRRHEVFPFFCWFLFPVTPNVQQQFVLRLREVDGTPLPSTPTYSQAGDWVTEPQSMDAYVAIQALGAAVTANDDSDVSRAWQTLCGNFLPGPSEVELLRVTQDPLQTWRGAPPLSAESIGSFRCRTAAAAPGTQQ